MKREVWASLLKLLPPQPGNGKAGEDEDKERQRSVTVIHLQEQCNQFQPPKKPYGAQEVLSTCYTLVIQNENLSRQWAFLNSYIIIPTYGQTYQQIHYTPHYTYVCTRDFSHCQSLWHPWLHIRSLFIRKLLQANSPVLLKSLLLLLCSLPLDMYHCTGAKTKHRSVMCLVFVSEMLWHTWANS